MGQSIFPYDHYAFWHACPTTERLIADYTRLMQLKAMDLPDDDPRMKAHGEMLTLRYQIDTALGIVP